jgi:CDP-glycerol glycerophosphotransferase (TagB/SpsB family)
VAPSWGAKGCLAEYGTSFLCALAEAGYTVIVRPHPQSYIAEPQFIAECKAKTAKYSNIEWDNSIIGMASMEKSDILVSDTSSIRFDYAFLYEKPVITLYIPQEKQTEYEGQFQTEIWTDAAAFRLGRVLDHSGIISLPQTIAEVLEEGSSSVWELRDRTIANLGCSAKVIVDTLVKEVVHV